MIDHDQLRITAKALMRHRSLSVAAVSRDAGIPLATLSSFYQGRRPLPERFIGPLGALLHAEYVAAVPAHFRASTAIAPPAP